jgi:uncharacterized repeat protein (TIGR03943 family)
VLLVALSGMLLGKVLEGAIVYYLRPDLTWTVIVAAFGLLLIGAAHLVRWLVVWPLATGWHATMLELMLLVPLTLGLLLPARPLDSAALDQRGFNVVALPDREARLRALNDDTRQWTLLDWTQALQGEVDPSRLAGQPVALIGFVYGNARGLQPGEFSVVRFVVSCCAADGLAVGMPVRWNGPTPDRDTWVAVSGTLAVAPGASGDHRAVIDAAAVERIDPPDTPYLYP